MKICCSRQCSDSLQQGGPFRGLEAMKASGVHIHSVWQPAVKLSPLVGLSNVGVHGWHRLVHHVLCSFFFRLKIRCMYNAHAIPRFDFDIASSYMAECCPNGKVVPDAPTTFITFISACRALIHEAIIILPYIHKA